MDKDTTNYTFECRESTEGMVEFPKYKDTNVSLEFDSSVRWICVLYEFCKFLSSIYGYDIVDQVEVNGNSLGSEALNPLTKEKINKLLDEHEDDDWQEPKNYMMGTADEWAEEYVNEKDGK